MSGYEKVDDYAYNDYEQQNARSHPPVNYPGLAQPTSTYSTPSTYQPSSQAPDLLQSLPLAATPITDLGSSVPTYSPRDTTGLEPASSSYFESRPSLVSHAISSSYTHEGEAGQTLQIPVDFGSNIHLDKCSFVFHFGNHSTCKGELQPPQYSIGSKRFVEVEVPDLGAGTIYMTLMLDINDENLGLLESKSLGTFRYGHHNYDSYSSGGKRKHSDFQEGSSLAGSLPQKRVASQPLRNRHLPPGGVTGLYPSSNFTINDFTSFYGSEYNSPRYYGEGRGRPQYNFTPHTGSAPHNSKARSPQMPSSSHLTRMKSPRIASQPLSRNVSIAPTPTLVRTSMANRQAALATASDIPTFNPYSVFAGAKANLKIMGDLMSMTKGWTTDERITQRRLVEFERTQVGNTIEATFKAVSPTERSPNNPCISCIWWERKQQWYCTSVDTIMLLESLVSVVFTVEEKNRIRRNLEGFKPYTVSKTKMECDDIFKLIMGFPAPKPRNIEKDIKIFYWSHLESALRKIIGKYSASYASTSSVLTPPTSSTSTYTTTLSNVALPLPATAAPSMIAPYPDMTNSSSLIPSGAARSGMMDTGAQGHHSHHHHTSSAHLSGMSLGNPDYYSLSSYQTVRTPHHQTHQSHSPHGWTTVTSPYMSVGQHSLTHNRGSVGSATSAGASATASHHVHSHHSAGSTPGSGSAVGIRDVQYGTSGGAGGGSNVHESHQASGHS